MSNLFQEYKMYSNYILTINDSHVIQIIVIIKCEVVKNSQFYDHAFKNI